MAKVKLVGMLVGLLFLMNLLRDYYAVAHQDHFLDLQHLDVDVPRNYHKLELGGRKMAHEASDDDHLVDADMAAYQKKLRYLKQQAFPATKNLHVAGGRKEGDDDDDDERRLMEATRKIVALMHRDYKGMKKPKRKPPINNHLPVH